MLGYIILRCDFFKLNLDEKTSKSTKNLKNSTAYKGELMVRQNKTY